MQGNFYSILLQVINSKFTPKLFFTRILLSTPSVSEDGYKKTPQWLNLDYEAEQMKKMDHWLRVDDEVGQIKKMEHQWLTVDDEVDHLPSTPPYLLNSSDDNMSGNRSTNLSFGFPKEEDTILISNLGLT